MSELNHLMQLREDQIEEASRILSRAFQDDPLFAYCYPDPIERKKNSIKLIRMKLAEIDKQNLPCYLHTENERNIKFYEHFGFELIGKNKVPNFDFYHYAMLRNRKKKE